MKPKPIRLFSRAAMLLMMTLTATTAWAWSGEGTEVNPYKITSANDLIQLATDVNGGETYSGKYFQQTGPITLTSAWTPIGTSTHPFKGHYDGGNNAISGLTVSGNYLYAGLFGYISSDRVNGSLVSNELQNIHIVDCNINVGSSNNSGSKAGGIAGQTGPVHLSDCRVSGTITAYNTACGLVGYADQSYGNSVTNCFVDVTVSATGKQYNQYANPIARLMLSVQANTPTASGNYYHDNGGSVTVGCSATQLYSVTSQTSGVAVAETNATLTFNGTRYYTANATTTLTVDDADKVITAFTATGAASSEVAANKKSATITLGSSDVTVSATLMALTGTSDGVTWSMSDSDSDGTYDRLTLSGSGTLSTSPWATDFAASITRVDISSADIAISGNPFSTLADGVVIVAPTPAYAVSYASAAFAGKLRVAFGNYLFLATNEGGTAAYAITDQDDLKHLTFAVKEGNSGEGKTFRQTGNITFSTFSFVPIGIDPTKCFSGTYDGGGYTISNLHVNFIGNDVVTYGLFGYVKNGLVENVRLVSPSVNVNNAYYGGALIGFADGTNGASTTIRNCVVISPDIDATKYAHGLIIGKQIDCTLKNLYVCHGREYYNGNPIKVIGEGSSGTNVGRAYRVILGSGISSVSPAINPAATDLDNGFVYDDYLYYRNGVELTLASNLGEAPEGYAMKYTASDGTISGSTLTVGNADAVVSAAIRSDGQSHSISYIDENGDDATHEAIALDETMTTLSEGWYFVGANITYTSKITLGGDVNIILADGKTMTTSSDSYGIDGYSNGYGLTIYGQALGTGTLNATGTGTNGIGIYTEGTVTINGGTLNATGTGTVGIRSIDGVTINGGTVTTTGIMADGDVTINGGKVTATDDPGISSNSGNITLGWTSADDRITASSYTDGTVTIASGKAFADEDGNIYTGTLSSDEKSKLADKTLTPACIISLPEGITATGVLAQNGTTAYAKAGDAITLAVASGYLLNGNITYTPDGGSATATTEDNGSYSFTMPAGNVTVNANIIKIISYIDADGKLQTISNYKKFPAEYNSQQNRRELTTTTLNAGEWYVVDNNITLADVEDVLTVSGSGAANIILCDGKELEYENWDSGYINGSLNIYGQSNGTGTFNYDNTNGAGHYAYQLIHGDLTIYGGQVTIAGADGVTDQNSTQCAIDGNVTIYRGSLYAKGGDDHAGFSGADAISGNVSFHGGSLMAIGGDKGSGDYNDGWGIYGNVTLDWSSPDDRFYANRYGHGMTIADGKAFADEDGNIYTGTLNYAQTDATAGKTLQPALLLADNADNSTQINALNGLTTAAILQGRTLYKDGAWNTLCLPFDVTSAQMAETTHPLYGATIMELDTEGTYEGGKQTGLDGTTLYLYFKNATSIEAGRPYIVRWGTPENNPGGVIENPAFTGVTIDKTDREVTFNGGWFEGTYRPINWTVENQSILFLGEKNTLYYPKAGAHLNACRAYFLLADPNGKAREIVLNFDGNETTGILSTTNGTNYTNKADAAWYTIDGVRLSAKPTAKGLYVHGNKKVVIK